MTTPFDTSAATVDPDPGPDVDPAGQDRPDVPVDALLLVSFGGPEAPDEVLPFMEQVTAGRGIPRARLEQVSEHYHLFGGRSPINDQNRALVAALAQDDGFRALDLPVYWGNRNWHPFLAEAFRAMAADGVRHAAAFVTSAYSSAAGCRQYRDDLARTQQELRAEGVGVPAVTRLDRFFDAPGFVEPFVDAVREARERLPAEARDGARLVFTAHSVPQAMADAAGPRGGAYVAQLRETARLVVQRLDPTGTDADWDLVYQSRSGPPHQPWLEPDVVDHLEALHAAGAPGVVLVPIGFVSDHMEVVYDLDTQAAERAQELGLPLVRAATPGTDARFVALVPELLRELVAGEPRRRLAGPDVPQHRWCPRGCCLPPTG